MTQSGLKYNLRSNLELKLSPMLSNMTPEKRLEIQELLSNPPTYPAPICPIVSDCKLSLDNLFFAYPTIGSDSSSYKHSYTLKNVSFSMPFGGYSIGIVGPSGTVYIRS